MVMHLVLYRPRVGLDAEARRRFANALIAARREIPSIRRFLVGRRIVGGPSYALGPFPDFPYVAAIEFEDRAALVEYLAHPTHGTLGQAFRESVDATLVYDYEATDAADAAAWLVDENGSRE